MSGEFAAIDRIARLLRPAPPTETWIGDDAAVLRGWPGPLVTAIDTVVDGVHADLMLTSVADLGWKAMAANLSDLAAMGATPRHALVSVAGPADTDLEALYTGVGEAAERYSCPVVGGDLSNSTVLVVTVAVAGSVDGRAVLRRGAGDGDGVWVTGPLGAAAAGLRLLRGGHLDGLDEASAVALRRAHARPVPLVAEGSAARLAGATAMVDVSDGFAADLGHLADASGVGFDLVDLPCAPGATDEEARSGGEDYQLVFTAPDEGAVRAAFATLPPPSLIGRVVADAANRRLGGALLAPTGWQHRWQ